MYLINISLKNKPACQRYCLIINNYAKGGGIINKCKLETQINILKLQCFYTTINSIQLQILLKKCIQKNDVHY